LILLFTSIIHVLYIYSYSDYSMTTWIMIDEIILIDPSDQHINHSSNITTIHIPPSITTIHIPPSIIITTSLTTPSTSLPTSSITHIGSLHPPHSSLTVIVSNLWTEHNLFDYPISSISSELLSMSDNYQLKYRIVMIMSVSDSITHSSVVTTIQQSITQSTVTTEHSITRCISSTVNT